MKLKNLTNFNDNNLNKLIEYIKSIDLKKSKGDILEGDYKKDNFYLYIDQNINAEESIKISIEIIKKYWQKFEDGIEFHSYPIKNYFVDIRKSKNDINLWEFIIESMDDCFYLIFNTNFVLNL